MNKELLPANPVSTSLDALRSVLDREAIRYEAVDNRITARFPAGVFGVEASVRFNSQWAFFMVRYNLFTPEEHRNQMTQAINKANWDLNVGNLEMDETDGEVRLRYSYALDDAPMSERVAEYLFFRVLLDAAEYAPTILGALTTEAPKKMISWPEVSNGVN
jgi:hypothetical protein